MIIDFHAHVPGNRNQWQVFVDECLRNGVGGAVVSSLGVSGWPAFPEAEQVRAANDHAREFAKFANGRGLRAWWFVYLNPLLDDVLEEMEHGLRAGAAGVKLWISLKDDSGRTSPCDRVLDAAGRRGCPVLIHTYNRTGGTGPGEVSLDEFAELARRFPGTTMIAAHAGGNWRLSLGALEGLFNASVDICGSFPEKGMVESLVEDLGVDRVVFGSDMLGRSLASQLSKVVLADIPEDAKAAVLGSNALRLLGGGAGDAGSGAASAVGGVDGDVFNGTPPDPLEEHFCFCGRWPFAADLARDVSKLADALDASGIRRAFTASLDALTASDPREANDEFRRAAARFPTIHPLAVVDPEACNAIRVLDAVDPEEFAGVLASPYIQNWRLDSASGMRFFDACRARGLRVWVTADFGDHRFRWRGAAWRPVAPEELAAFAQHAPVNEYILQGLSAKDILAITRGRKQRGTRFRFEISRLTDRTGDLAAVLRQVDRGALVFGSEFPLRDMRQVRWTASRVL